MTEKHNIWMSVSDLMTGLMIIFLFIAIAYMIQVQKSQSVLAEYVETRKQLYDKLQKEFEAAPDEWQLAIGKDLSMKFENPEIQFNTGKANLQPAFKSILDEFIPRYINILVNDTLKVNIKEIRIEGHTDDTPPKNKNKYKDAYMYNLSLSQQRAFEVLQYIRNMPSYQNYPQETKKLLEYWFTANGLSYGKALDKNGEYTFISNEKINKKRSRRVEFRIVTSGDEILENFVNKNQ